MPPEFDPLIYTVLSALRRAGLGVADRLVVGLSGGVDSQTLTHVLRALREQGEGPALLLVHVDHQLRPESAQDARAVARIAATFNLPIEIKQVDVAQWSITASHGIEAGARAARYAALADAARGWGTEWVAVGHNLDDQVETVLLRLARGTSPDGLAGMRELSTRAVSLDPASSNVRMIHLLRPLLNVRRSEIEAFAAKEGLVPIVDESNSDTRFRRNSIRHELIPILERIVPGASVSIARSADLLADDVDLLSDQAHEGFLTCCRPRDRCVELHREPFRAYAVPLQRRIMVLAVHAVSREVELTRERVEALRAATLTGPVSCTIEVGAGISARVDYDRVMLGPGDVIEAELRLSRRLPALQPGSVVAVDGSTTLQTGSRWEIVIAAPSLLGGWQVRTRRKGDRLLLTDGRHVRLQDWLVNRKVPSYARDYLPLLVHDGDVRWVAGISVSPFEDVNSRLVARLVERPGNDRLDGEQTSTH